MKALIIFLVVIAFVSCKKENNDPVEDTQTEEGAYPGKIKSINDIAWKFRYDEEGKLYEYDYLSSGVTKTVILTWASGNVIVNNGIGFTAIRPFNSDGYVLPGPSDIPNEWTYDSVNQIAYMDGADYYWSNGNIDSVYAGPTKTYFSYSNEEDTRDFGANLIPKLPNFPDFNFNLKNLKSHEFLVNSSGDTALIKLYNYGFDANNRITSELVDIVVNGDTSYFRLNNYAYYE